MDLVMLVCLAAQPAACREQRLEFVAAAPVACLTAAPAAIAQFAGDHPEFLPQPERWRCEPIERRR